MTSSLRRPAVLAGQISSTIIESATRASKVRKSGETTQPKSVPVGQGIDPVVVIFGDTTGTDGSKKPSLSRSASASLATAACTILRHSDPDQPHMYMRRQRHPLYWVRTRA